MLPTAQTSIVPPINKGKMGCFIFMLLLHATLTKCVLGEDVTEESTVLEELPREFQCVKEGSFPVLGSCNEFYQCHKTKDGNFPVQEIIGSCPSKTIFDANSAKCLFPPLVTIRPQCLNVSATSASASNCSQELFEDITMSVTQTCQSMRDISKYVKTVASRLPFRRSRLNYQEFNRVIRDYNAVLTLSKGNVRGWNNGNDISSDIETLFEKVIRFGKEFMRKYNINQERRMSLYISDQNKDEEKIVELQEEIKVLQTDIEELEELINATFIPNVKSFLEMTLKNKQIEIAKKNLQINQTSPIGRELEEVAAFLEFVADDAEEVRQRADTLEIRLKTFHENIENDFVSYGNVYNLVSEGIDGLLNSKEKLTSKVTDNREDLEGLVTLKKQKEAMLSFMNDAADSKSSEIREKIGEIQSKEEDYLRQRNNLCIPQNMILSLLTFRGIGNKNTTACLELEAGYNASITEDVNTLEALNDEFSRINTERFMLLSQIGKIMKNMTIFHDLLASDDHVSLIEDELKEFELLVNDLRPLDSMANATLSAVNESIKSIEEVKVAFQVVIENLNEMVSRINAARTAETQQKAKTDIDSVLRYLLCQTEQIREQNPIMANCQKIPVQFDHGIKSN